MQESSENRKEDYLDLTTEIVSAYVQRNSLPRADLPALIGAVHSALAGLSAPAPAEDAAPTPPVPVKSTIRPDYIISLEDGRRYKSLRRHLSARGLTPEQYRAKWGLRPDYPMVAPNYSKARSDLAKALGLGRARKGRSGGKGGAKKARRSS
jgi:predicted transcriptional regulator